MRILQRNPFVLVIALLWSAGVCSGQNLGGSVVAWGDNSYGEINVPPGLTNVIAIAAGGLHSLALKNDGTVSAWGLNGSGQTDVPSGLSNVVAVAAGWQYSLALRSDGIVQAWGANESGQAIPPPSLSNVVAIAAGQYNSLALKADGTVVQWGTNGFGPGPIPAGLSNIVAIAAGYFDSVALRADGTVVQWGYNWNNFQNVPSGLSNVVSIAAGGLYSMAVKSDGTLVEWGPTYNDYPTKPVEATNIVAIALGEAQSGSYYVLGIKLALRNDGTLFSWGRPVTNPDLTNVVRIASGAYHCLALENSGAPVVTINPVNQQAVDSATFFVGAAGTPPLTFQWQFNGTNIDSATNTVLTLTNLQMQLTSAGSYDVIVSNFSGTVTSLVASLTITVFPPQITAQPASQLIVLGSNCTFAVTASGTPPLNYQWQFNGTNIIGATNISLTLSNLQSSQQGNYVVRVSNSFGSTISSNATLTITDLGYAVNATNLVWNTSGSAVWFPELSTTYDGVQAAQSGSVNNGQQSILQTTVTGPGTLTFWWMFSPSTLPFPNSLSFSTSQSNNTASVNSTSGWEQKTFYLGAGTQTLSWTYYRYFVFSGQSTGWVDQVTFTPGSTLPTITSAPTNLYVRVSANATLAVSAFGTPPLRYQWQFNGTNLNNKTNATLSLYNVQPANSGTYTVVITNNYGSVSNNTILSVQQFALSTNPTNLLMTPTGFQLQLDGALTTNSVIIFASTDLVGWLPVFTNPATTGSIQFLDVMATNLPKRFYRAQE